MMSNRKIFFLLALGLIGMVALTSLGIAYAGGIRGAGLLGVCFFLTGGILVVLAQVIPAGIILSSLIGGTFSSSRRGELPIRAT
jgi:hypothetical protein